MKRLFTIAATVLLLGMLPGGISAAGEEDYEKPPFNYSAAVPNDAIFRLQKQVAAGAVDLSGSGKSVLQAILGQLRIPVETQLLALSETSFQRSRINPGLGGALYPPDT